eukprot:NODE_20270_length_805_cov_7.585546.p3 GENE.NODE_20270_length_805_cov_7.585546~~NODE_20270_length_805_cov_7.585546.p3  ORF type:complete len:71 (-),score=24.13 NODE_20270_length_805_cov_7.585546:479-691(-)
MLYFNNVDMNRDARVTHANFVRYVFFLEGGFKVPLLGTLTPSRLTHSIKVIMAAAPLIVTYTLRAFTMES